jgi:hypothetical protein
MGLQAHIYQNSSVLNLNEFIKSAKSVVSDPSLNQLL